MSKLDKLINQFLSKPPEISFKDVLYILESFGYQEVRSKGSHHAFENEQGEVIIIPKKGGKKVNRTYIEAIIKLLNLEDKKDETK